MSLYLFGRSSAVGKRAKDGLIVLTNKISVLTYSIIALTNIIIALTSSVIVLIIVLQCRRNV